MLLLGPLLCLSLPLPPSPLCSGGHITQKNGWIINSNSINEETAAALRKPLVWVSHSTRTKTGRRSCTHDKAVVYFSTTGHCTGSTLLKYCKARSFLTVWLSAVYIEKQESSRTTVMVDCKRGGIMGKHGRKRGIICSLFSGWLELCVENTYFKLECLTPQQLKIPSYIWKITF